MKFFIVCAILSVIGSSNADFESVLKTFFEQASKDGGVLNAFHCKDSKCTEAKVTRP